MQVAERAQSGERSGSVPRVRVYGGGGHKGMRGRSQLRVLEEGQLGYGYGQGADGFDAYCPTRRFAADARTQSTVSAAGGVSERANCMPQ
jgi:hypothetical protein